MTFNVFVCTIVVTVVLIRKSQEQNLINYKCNGNEVLVIHSRTDDYVKMHCGVPQICGESRACQLSATSGLCAGNGNFLMGVDENGDRSVRATCCQYNPPVKMHSKDRCVTQEIHDRLLWQNLTNSGSGSTILERPGSIPSPPESNPSNVVPPLPDQKPSGPKTRVPPKPGSSLGSGLNGPMPNALMPTGSRPVNGIADLSLFQLVYKQAPVELVKGIERIPNGYRVTSCMIECDQTTTTPITSTMATTKIMSTSKSNQITVLPSTNLPSSQAITKSTVGSGIGSAGGSGTTSGGCQVLTPETKEIVQNIREGKINNAKAVPGFQETGTYCAGMQDIGCLKRCLLLLQSRFQSATCEASTSNCICRQELDQSKFEQNLKVHGIDTSDPLCSKGGATSSHAQTSASTGSSSGIITQSTPQKQSTSGSTEATSTHAKGESSTSGHTGSSSSSHTGPSTLFVTQANVVSSGPSSSSRSASSSSHSGASTGSTGSLGSTHLVTDAIRSSGSSSSSSHGSSSLASQSHSPSASTNFITQSIATSGSSSSSHSGSSSSATHSGSPTGSLGSTHLVTDAIRSSGSSSSSSHGSSSLTSQSHLRSLSANFITQSVATSSRSGSSSSATSHSASSSSSSSSSTSHSSSHTSSQSRSSTNFITQSSATSGSSSSSHSGSSSATSHSVPSSSGSASSTHFVTDSSRSTGSSSSNTHSSSSGSSGQSHSSSGSTHFITQSGATSGHSASSASSSRSGSSSLGHTSSGSASSSGHSGSSSIITTHQNPSSDQAAVHSDGHTFKQGHVGEGREGQGGGSGSGAGGCFSAEMLVKTRSGPKRMDEIQVGDEVLVVTTDDITAYEPVEWFYHRDTTAEFTFVNIVTESNRRLSLTYNHLLVFVPCDQNNLTPSEVNFYTSTSSKFSHKAQVGHCVPSIKNGKLFADKIVQVRVERKRGIFSPITSSGTIIVNGIHASCYSTVENHLLQYSIHKVLISVRRFVFPLWNIFTDCNAPVLLETMQEVPPVLMFIFEIAKLVLPSNFF